MTYPYKPMDPIAEMRLLLFHPLPRDATLDSPIVCSLIHTSLPSPLEYEALSYVWGNAVLGSLSDCDPATEVTYYSYNEDGEPGQMVRAQLKDMAHHPTYQHQIFGQGYPRSEATIVIDDTEVNVGGELYSALRRLRALWAVSKHKSRTTPVWVDALCINQGDIKERNAHVTRMGEIYTHAKKVRIWLGDEYSDADRVAFEALDVLTSFFEGSRLAGELQDYVSMRKRFSEDPRMEQVQWHCLGALLSRAWFQRSWVIQEVALASQAAVHLGRQGCFWRHISMVVSELKRLDLDFPLWEYSDFTAGTTVALMAELNDRRQDPNKGTRITLLEILNNSRDFKCTVLSDKIFGVLGLADDKDSYPVPDYSLPPQDVFRGIATSLVKNEKTLKILYHCSKSGTGLVEGPPSWAPDWTRRCLHTPLYLTSLQCRSSGDSNFSFQFDNNTLQAHGRIFETIHNIDHDRKIPRIITQKEVQRTTILDHEGKERELIATPDLKQQHPRETMRQSVHDQWQYIGAILNMAFPGEEYTEENFEALWRTFVCNQTMDNEPAPAHWAMHFSAHVAGIMHVSGASEEWSKKLRNTSSTTSETGMHPLPGIAGLREAIRNFKVPLPPLDHDTYQFYLAHGERCHDRRFFVSETGRFGWGPDGMEEGDAIAILNGLDFPLVLRHVKEGYEVVGDCYAHGIMLGEAMENTLDEVLPIV